MPPKIQREPLQGGNSELGNKNHRKKELYDKRELSGEADAVPRRKRGGVWGGGLRLSTPKNENNGKPKKKRRGKRETEKKRKRFSGGQKKNSVRGETPGRTPFVPKGTNLGKWGRAS